MQDERGLRVTGRFHSTPKAQETRTVIKERLDRGKTCPTSIGYLVPVDGERYEKRDGRTVRRISKLAVYEASFVNLPANPEAEVVAAKSLQESEKQEGIMPTEMGAINALKRILGLPVKARKTAELSTKGGRKMSGATFEKMKGFHKAMDDHAEDGIARCKSFRKAMNDYTGDGMARSKAFKDVADEFHKTLKNLTGGQQQEVDENNEGDVAEDDEKEDPLDEDEDKEDEDEDEKEEDEEDEDEAKARAKRKRKQDDEDEDEDEKRSKRRKEDDEEDEDEAKARKARAKRRRKEEDDDDESDEQKAMNAYRLNLAREFLARKYPAKTG
jgi:hypothetical protein